LSGGLTTDFGPTFGDPYFIEKAMFLPVQLTGSANNRTATGIVLSFPGFMKGGIATDEIYAQGLVPVGSIAPYSGALNELTDEWLYCDGRKLRPGLWKELYRAIGTSNGFVDNQKYYVDASFPNITSANFYEDEDKFSVVEVRSGSSSVVPGIIRLDLRGGNRGLISNDLVRISVYDKKHDDRSGVPRCYRLQCG
jgi:hypothetical protein